MDDQLDSECHMSYIDTLRCKLTPVRTKHSLRQNATLFKMLVLPLYRLGVVNISFKGKAAINKYTIHMRKNLRRFCRIPYNTPNRIVDSICGKIEKELKTIVTRAQRKVKKRAG